MSLMTAARDYPWYPKSTKGLEPGHYWSIALDDGTYACGVILETDVSQHPTSVIGALLDWHGDTPPGPETRTVSSVLKHGQMGIHPISRYGDGVRGHRDLDEYPVSIPETVSHRAGGQVWVLLGTTRVRPATREEAESLPGYSTLGGRFLKTLANTRFAGVDPPELPLLD
jgi:hypothetical protein